MIMNTTSAISLQSGISAWRGRRLIKYEIRFKHKNELLYIFFPLSNSQLFLPAWSCVIIGSEALINHIRQYHGRTLAVLISFQAYLQQSIFKTRNTSGVIIAEETLATIISAIIQRTAPLHREESLGLTQG